MPRKAKVVISERQQEYLRRLAESRTCPADLAQRARMILFAYDKCNNATIALRLGCEASAVRVWRNRWAERFDRLVHAECLESDDAFRLALIDALSDNPGANCGRAERLARSLADDGELVRLPAVAASA
jgi:hypothetical protein